MVHCPFLRTRAIVLVVVVLVGDRAMTALFGLSTLGIEFLAVLLALPTTSNAITLSVLV